MYLIFMRHVRPREISNLVAKKETINTKVYAKFPQIAQGNLWYNYINNDISTKKIPASNKKQNL